MLTISLHPTDITDLQSGMTLVIEILPDELFDVRTSSLTECIILKKCFYDFIHAASPYNEKTVDILKKAGFTRGKFAKCFYMKKYIKGMVCVNFHVDNNFMIGSPWVTDEAVKQLKKNELVLKAMDSIKDYISNEI